MIGYIYLITNKVNGKQYVGKTYLDIEKRLTYHINDSKRKRMGNRPLYRAINKYGQENFIIELLEQCDKNLEKREIFWIKSLETYGKGYNATLGGDGKRYFEYTEEEVIKKYLELETIKDTALFFNCDKHTIRKILSDNNITVEKGGIVTKKRISKKVSFYNNIENKKVIFNSTRDAGKYIKETQNRDATFSHIAITISRCCDKKLKSAYGVIWEWEK